VGKAALECRGKVIPGGLCGPLEEKTGRMRCGPKEAP
jgi:hypothetical protein